MGNNTKNFIEINGKRYDAVTGALLGAAAPAVRQPGRPASKGHSVDGFARVSRAPIPGEPLQPILKKISEPVKAPIHVAAPAKKHVVRPAAQHAVHHKPQPAKTLMRSAVRKPDIKSVSVIKAQTRTDILATVPANLVPMKLSHGNIDKARLRRATRMIQSPAVSRYGRSDAPLSVITAPKPASAPVKTVVAENPRPHVASMPVMSMQPSSQRRPRSMDSISRRAPVHHPAQHQAHPPAQNDHDIFEKALADAKSHEQKYTPSKPKNHAARRVAKFATVTFTALLLVGFFGYQNLPNLNMKLASAKAGFNAKMPGYSPSGFSYGDLSYQPGSVNVSFAADADNRRFDITQKTSTWDSQALLSNFVSSASKTYQTYERAGRTVYLYGDNTATWVDNGVWYLIDGNSSLSRAELIDVAISI